MHKVSDWYSGVGQTLTEFSDLPAGRRYHRVVARIDQYISHLDKHKATGVRIVTDQPITFLFGERERAVKRKLSSKDIMQVVREIATADEFERLQRVGLCNFRYEAPAGAMKVEARVGADNQWWVKVSPWKDSLNPGVGFQAKLQPTAGEEPAAEGQQFENFVKGAHKVDLDLSGSAEIKLGGTAFGMETLPQATGRDLDLSLGVNEPPKKNPSRDKISMDLPPVPDAAPSAFGAASEEKPTSTPKGGLEGGGFGGGGLGGGGATGADASSLPSLGGGANSLPSIGGPPMPPPAPSTTPEEAEEAAPAPELGMAVARLKTPIKPVAGEPRLNHFLRLMVSAGSSDLHMKCGSPPLARVDGSIKIIEEREPFTASELEAIIDEIMPPTNKEEYDESNDTDFAHAVPGLARFRANILRDRFGIAAVFRQIPFEILPVDVLGLPPKVLDLCFLTKGLVLVTGPTGSGKSTTLASMIDFMNRKRPDHIITIEDPVEFVHQNKRCLITQREVGTHTNSFKRALRAALREDPDIVLVGELRDLETIAIAIETAETGHLVFGTLHTTSAISTVDRLVDQFPADQQEQIRVMLSESMRGVVAQVLCKKIGGGRAAAYEVLIGTPAVGNLIREGKTFQIKSIMQTGKKLGMQTMNGHLISMVSEGIVDPTEAYMKSNDKILFRSELKKIGIEIDLSDDH